MLGGNSHANLLKISSLAIIGGCSIVWRGSVIFQISVYLLVEFIAKIPELPPSFFERGSSGDQDAIMFDPFSPSSTLLSQLSCSGVNF